MAFGKRHQGVGTAAQAVNAGSTARSSRPADELRGPSPLRWFIMLVVCAAGIYYQFVNYGPDLVRDHRLSGTWQPAYDLQATDGKCERIDFVVTTCNAKIISVARPDQAPTSHSFLMFFSSGGGEALVPVRSTKDRSAVSTFYAAETKLWNRTLSFIVAAGLLALLDLVALLGFWNAVNSFDS